MPVLGFSVKRGIPPLDSFNNKRIRCLFDGYLVSIQLAGNVLMLQSVADRASMRTRSRVAASEPLLYQCSHLLMRELVSKLYRRVTCYGGEDPLLSAHPGCCTPHGGDRLPKTCCHITALCQGRDHPVYPEGVLAKLLVCSPFPNLKIGRAHV